METAIGRERLALHDEKRWLAAGAARKYGSWTLRCANSTVSTEILPRLMSSAGTTLALFPRRVNSFEHRPMLLRCGQLQGGQCDGNPFDWNPAQRCQNIVQSTRR